MNGKTEMPALRIGVECVTPLSSSSFKIPSILADIVVSGLSVCIGDLQMDAPMSDESCAGLSGVGATTSYWASS